MAANNEDNNGWPLLDTSGPYSWSVEIFGGYNIINDRTHNKYPCWFHRKMMTRLFGWTFKIEK